MSQDKRRISIADLPEDASAALRSDDVQECDTVKGGATRVGIRAGERIGIRAGERIGIRALRKGPNIRKIGIGDSWLQR